MYDSSAPRRMAVAASAPAGAADGRPAHDVSQPRAQSAIRRVALMVNAQAGGSNGQAERNCDRFAAHFASVTRIAIGASGEHAARLREISPAVDAIAVAGGDGTVNRLLPLLIERQRPVGLLPSGTANDLAHTLGIPFDPDGAARIMLAGHTRAVDVGMANDVPFVNAAGIGASVAVSREMSVGDKAAFGVAAYARAVWRVLHHCTGFTVALTGDGISYHGRAIQVTVANGVRYGGGMTVHESAAIDDGKLDVLVVRPRSILEYLRYFLAFRRGRYGPHAPVWVGRATRLRVVSARTRACALDGEIRLRTPVDFTVERSAFEMFVPDDAGTTA
jgi:diacylglycerol kinase (ATP)